jgi:cell division protein FtsI (penicillin-binding protein 3)
MRHTADISLRAYGVFVFLMLIGLGVMGRVFYIQFFSSGELKKQTEGTIYKLAEIEPSRGQIFSSDGRLLATSVPKYDLVWDTRVPLMTREVFSEKLDSIATGLASVLGGEKRASDYRSLLTKEYNAGSRYARIVKEIDHLQKKEIARLPLIVKGRYKYGFYFEAKDSRELPFGSMAKRTIGKFGTDGKYGLELTYNEVLSGRSGKRYMEKIGGGWRPVNDNFVEKPINGLDLVSTIDVHVQDIATNALRNQMFEHNARWGTCVLMETKTGYVRAIANLSRTETGTLVERENIAADYSSEPGSTFKLMSLMAALDDGLIKPTDTVETGQGEWTYKGRPLRDSNFDKVGPDGKRGNGTITIEEVFAKSSNIGTAKAVLKAYEGNQQAFLDKIHSFGIHEPLGLELQSEPKPVVKSQASGTGWSGTDLMSMSIGYSVSMTPLQILAFYNGVINDGEVIRPLFVQEIRDNGKVVKRMRPETIRELPVKNSTLKAVRKMMEATALEGGTADWIFSPKDPKKQVPYTVGGKTGTARIHRDGAYQDRLYRASFIGYFPADEPKYTCIVVISEPSRGQFYGSSVAAPVFKEIANKLYVTDPEFKAHKTMGVEPKLPISKDGVREPLVATYDRLSIRAEISGHGPWVAVSTRPDTVRVADKNLSEGLVPNVKGMGLRDALFLLENLGMRVEVRGAGTVRQQSVTPGSSLRNHKYITIELS